MKILVLSDFKRFDDFLKFYKFPKESFKCANEPRHIRGHKFDYYIELYTHLDLSDCYQEIKIYNIPQITIKELEQLFRV